MSNSQFVQSIEVRVQDIFHAYQQGKDVSPAQLFQTEGLIEAACMLNLLSRPAALSLVSEAYTQIFNSEMPVLDIEGDKLSIPIQMQRAPVAPS